MNLSELLQSFIFAVIIQEWSYSPIGRSDVSVAADISCVQHQRVDDLHGCQIRVARPLESPEEKYMPKS